VKRDKEWKEWKESKDGKMEESNFSFPSLPFLAPESIIPIISWRWACFRNSFTILVVGRMEGWKGGRLEVLASILPPFQSVK